MNYNKKSQRCGNYLIEKAINTLKEYHGTSIRITKLKTKKYKVEYAKYPELTEEISGKILIMRAEYANFQYGKDKLKKYGNGKNRRATKRKIFQEKFDDIPQRNKVIEDDIWNYD